MASAAKEPQVPAACQKLESAIKQLQDIISDMETRLGAVLRASDEPRDAKALLEERPEMVPLAEDLLRKVGHIDNTTEALRGLLRRLEL